MELTAHHITLRHSRSQLTAVLGGGDDAPGTVGAVEAVDKVDEVAVLDRKSVV